MTKKDYELIAGILGTELEIWKANAGPVYGQEGIEAIKELSKTMARRLGNDNPKFDRTKFLRACRLHETAEGNLISY